MQREYAHQYGIPASEDEGDIDLPDSGYELEVNTESVSD